MGEIGKITLEGEGMVSAGTGTETVKQQFSSPEGKRFRRSERNCVSLVLLSGSAPSDSGAGGLKQMLLSLQDRKSEEINALDARAGILIEILHQAGRGAWLLW